MIRLEFCGISELFLKTTTFKMIYAFDTYFYEDYAYTVCVAFEDWAYEKKLKFTLQKQR